MRINEFLAELLDRPLPLKWEEEPGYLRAYFDVNGKEGMVKFYYEAFVWTIDFFIDGRHDITGQGNELAIFSTVSKAILEFISKHNPNLIAFSAREPSRAKLYKRMSQRLTGYTIDPELSKQAGFGLKKIRGNELPENFADEQTPSRKELDPDVYEDLSNSIIARIARQIVPTIRAKSTPEGYVYLSTQDGLSLVIGCNIAGGSIDINIGSQPMETTSSGPHKGAVTKIIAAVYQAAVKRYGTPTEQGTLSIDHDAGHGVWQHIAQKLGLQYDAHMVKENFANGRHPEDKGDSKRYGINTKASVSSLRKSAKHSSGRKRELEHWLANMKSGHKK